MALALVVAIGAVGLAGCGEPESGPPGGATTITTAASTTSTPVAGAFTAGSNVDSHAAIGSDIARVKELLAVTKTAGAVDWPAVKAIWENGGASKKSDGSTRTLRKLIDAPADVALVDDAIAGTAPAGASDAVRSQYVDKGISVLLSLKVIDELGAAAKKVATGQTAPEDGAPHNVDEAWAFFTAGGNGLAATAEKRATDFKLDGKVVQPILSSLTLAQAAAGKGDSSALTQATIEVRQGLDYIFYLATFKYLTAKDEIGKAEGTVFYRGIQPRVAAADPAGDTAIVAAFNSADATSGRASLNGDAVLKALGVSAVERVTA